MDNKVVHHRGRRFKRNSDKNKDDTHGLSSMEGVSVLPPPTPPSAGKTRQSMKQFPYQRFKPLPSIGSARTIHVSKVDSAVDMTSPSPDPDIQQKHLTTNQVMTDNNIQTLSCDRGQFITKQTCKEPVDSPAICHSVVTSDGPKQHTPQSKVHVLPPEPSSNSQCSVTLCVRLPNGTRIQRRFNYTTDTVGTVILFAKQGLQDIDGADMPDDCELASNTVPKVVYKDLFLRLEQAGLVHNTLLCLSIL